MRMKLSPYWWNNLYFLFSIGIVAEIFMLWFYFRYCASGNEPPYAFVFMILIALAIVSTALAPWRFLMTMELRVEVFRAFLFGKLKCEVFTDKEIYYAIFKCYESATVIKTYIAISNEMFQCNKKKPTFWSANRFIDYYDREKQIIFPYTEETKHLFATSKWTCINQELTK